MMNKTQRRKTLELIKNNIQKKQVLDPDRELHIGVDEGGILGSPIVYLTPTDKNKIPKDVPYMGFANSKAIKKYLTMLCFMWVMFDLPDYSEKLEIKFIE